MKELKRILRQLWSEEKFDIIQQGDIRILILHNSVESASHSNGTLPMCQLEKLL